MTTLHPLGVIPQEPEGLFLGIGVHIRAQERKRNIARNRCSAVRARTQMRSPAAWAVQAIRAGDAMLSSPLVLMLALSFGDAVTMSCTRVPVGSEYLHFDTGGSAVRMQDDANDN